MIRQMWIGVAALLMLGAAPPADFDVSTLSVGHVAHIGAQTPGRPLVVVVFASWCIPCAKEMTTVIADYGRYKYRVDFLGVDYLDTTAAGEQFVSKYGVRFPVVQSHPSATQPTPAMLTDPAAKNVIKLDGVTPANLARLLPMLEARLPAPIVARIQELASYCSTHSSADCTDFGSAHDIMLSGATRPVSSTSSTVTSSSSSTSSSTTTSLGLPHLFILDGQGVVHSDIDGYDADKDDIASELAKLF
jgi:thiol-disulfide isomerase/thioredoxin